MKRLILLTLLLTTPRISVEAQQSATLFRGAKVFDGTRVLEGNDVLVQNGLVSRVGRGIRPPTGAVIIDAAGKTLMPGLIDAHTHTFSEEILREAAVFGVTTHLDMFTDTRFAKSMRDAQVVRTATGRADLFSAGTLVTAPKGHGTQMGMTIPTITSPDSAQAFVDARIAEGSDYIKIVLDDGHAYGLRYGTLDRPTLTALIAAAHKRGKLAVVHIGDAESARMAIEAGADGLVHLFTAGTDDPAFARLVSTKRAFVIPTMTVLQSITGVGGGAPLVEDERMTRYLSLASRQNLTSAFPARGGAKSNRDIANSTVRQLLASGVRILAGSDAPNPGTWFGAAMHRELELLVAAGLTPKEALVAATSAPAEAFRLSDRGRIAAGKRADLVLVDGDPTTDIRATRAISGVWKDGVRIDRDAVARRIAAANEAESRGPTIPADGLISNFEQGATASIGSWLASADNIAGGTSTGEMVIVDSGATSAKALGIRGTITNTVAYAWYGAMWSPGTQPMAPANLSRQKGISFDAQGDGKTYRLMLFSRSKGNAPLIKTFVASPAWQRHDFTWQDFGIDGSDIMGVVFAGGPQPGPISFRLDNVRLR